jgi:hypothetical protein
MMTRLSNLLSKTPVTGKVSISPMGKANRTAPSWASFKCSCCWIAGILDAHVENPKPDKKKKTVTMVLCLPGDTDLTCLNAIPQNYQ